MHARSPCLVNRMYLLKSLVRDQHRKLCLDFEIKIMLVNTVWIKRSQERKPGVSMTVKQSPLPNQFPTFHEISKVCDSLSSPTLQEEDGSTRHWMTSSLNPQDIGHWTTRSPEHGVLPSRVVAQQEVAKCRLANACHEIFYQIILQQPHRWVRATGDEVLGDSLQ